MSNIVNIDGKFYDLGTKNTSFLLTAQELKTLGIKNWYFMLEVKYPHLGVQDIDPFDPNIKPDQIAKLHIENKNNVWFFMRECLRIPVGGMPKPIPFELNRAACAAMWCYDHSIDFMLNQPRQTHKTTTALGLMVYTFVYKLKNVTLPMMHLTEKKVIKNATDFKAYVEALPPYMNPFKNKRKVGIKSMAYDEHDTKISLVTSADNEVTAGDKLRGDTVFVANLDEWEYIKFIDSVIMGATPAILSGRNIAKSAGSVSCIMYTSTPGNLETPEGKAAQKMIDATPVWNEQIYDFTSTELDNIFSGYINDDGEELKPVTRFYIEYDYIQLRKDEIWLKEQYQEAAATGKIAEYRRGVLLQRFRGSDVVLFNQSDIDYIVNNQRKPDHVIFINKQFQLNCYNHKMYATDLNSDTPYFDITIPYLIGIDVSAGTGGDNTTVCVVHPYTLEVVAELKSPYIGTTDLMKIITTLATLIPHGTFCLEANSIGKSIVAFVQESELEHRFYHDPKLDISKNSVNKTESVEMKLKRKATERKYIGTTVSETNRQQMFQLLKRNIKDHKQLIYTKYLVEDIQNLVMKNDKIQAESGEHDDMVMAYLHTIYVLEYGHDLTRFGIDKTKCTFAKEYEIIKDYEKSLNENKVDNMIHYDDPDCYEERLLNDLTKAYDSSNSDPYGYTESQYNHVESQYVPINNNIQKSEFTHSDFAFCDSLNNFG